MGDWGHARGPRYSSYSTPHQRGEPSRNANSAGPIKRPQIVKTIDVESQLFKGIFHVGEDINTILVEITELSKLLIGDFDAQKPQIVKILRYWRVVIIILIIVHLAELPWKTSIYATVFGFMNMTEPKLGEELMAIVGEAMDATVAAHNWKGVKLVMRFYADLLNCSVIEVSSLLTLLDVFITAASVDGTPEERSDCLMYIVLCTICWAAKTLNEKDPIGTDRILAACELYMNARALAARSAPRAIALEGMLYVRGAAVPPVDLLESLWTQILELAQGDWEVAALPKPWRMFSLENQAPAQPRPLTLPHDEVTVRYPFQGFRFRIHTTIPNNLDRFILEDLTTDIVQLFAHNHPIAAKNLLGLSNYVNTTINLHDLIVETCFAELFRLPRSTERPVYYMTLISDLCKASLEKIPPALGRAIRGIYGMLDIENPDGQVVGGLDVECIQRFGEWFAEHLSNFGYNWKWAEWDSVLIKDDSSSQMVFAREVLERCVRLSYYDRIKATLPASYKDVATVFYQQAPRPNFKYEQTPPEGMWMTLDWFHKLQFFH
ncbi:hypothetical protein SmJEL517_g01308 [Synchytrium microbalum]|uniref:MIF4G-like type 1 domain-containing protein n=1 Tax=Synchytrium microbalum TaxID=1806994 RepID=A0A507CFC8_9FUNG|nr:uncharacterized protein SmJEL517_g01308 [Synchytrium microbalum]TPX36634.1 hypothetical protein SmJEL517_g01308 [Synchytrium microbalum]